MIVLDASVLIAFVDSRDAHHDRATELLVRAARDDSELLVNPITLAEALVGPARAGHADATAAALRRAGVQNVELEPDAPLRLADLRVKTGLKMPDCCVLLAAVQRGAKVASFDERLESAAAALGL